MLKLEVFVFEFVSINWLSSSSVSSGEISSLDHEVGDNSVEGATGVFASRVVAFTQSDEIFNSFRDNLPEKI